MKSFVFLLVSLLACTITGSLHAQMIYQNGRELENSGFSSTTTYVQLIGDKDYDEGLKEALSTGWTLTRNIEFVEPGDSLGDPTDPRRSYISMWTIREGSARIYLVLWQGGKTWSKRQQEDGSFSQPYYWNSWVVSVQLDVDGKEPNDKDIAWRLPLAVASMLQMVRYGMDEHVKTPYGGTDAHVMEGLDTHALQHKKLLVRRDRFSEQEIAALHANYPFSLEVVDTDVIVQAIADRDPGVAVMVFAASGGHQRITVQNAADRKLLYVSLDIYCGLRYGLPDKMVKALAHAVER